MTITRSSSATAALWVIAAIAGVFLLRATRELLIPIVIAVLITYALEPVVCWLQRRHIPRALGALVLLASLLGVFGWGAYTLRDEVLEAVDALPQAARRAREFVWSRTGNSEPVQRAVEDLERSAAGAGQEDGSRGNAWLQRTVGSLIALAGYLTVVVFLVFFLLLSGGHFRRRLIEIAGPRLERRRITATIIDDINAQIQRFLLVRLVTSAVVAVATWGVLAWMEVPQAAVWGILAGVVNSIPYFGPILVSGGLLVVGLTESGDLIRAVEISGAALVITSLEGWLLTPTLLGRAEHMHAVVVFLGLLVWTWIWGAWGTILAVPMLVVFKAIADRVEGLKPISRLMAP